MALQTDPAGPLGVIPVSPGLEGTACTESNRRALIRFQGRR